MTRSVLMELPNGRLVFVGGARTYRAAIAMAARALQREGVPLRTPKQPVKINKAGAYVVQTVLPSFVRWAD